MVISFSPTLVEVVSITPNSGYTSSQSRNTALNLSVKLSNGTNTSIVSAIWRDSEAHIDTTEN